jgi:hypothetical protein
MTLPYERTRAVLSTESFLKELLDPKKTPGVPSVIRRQANSLLRHYPTPFEMNVVCEHEEQIHEGLNFKVFGKSL